MTYYNTSLSSQNRARELPAIYLYSAMTLFIIISLYVFAILLSNNGNFVYTLDDPYIHLALAENIWQGHYGLNSTDFSSPSSSIIWPLLLAPMSFSSWSPLIINGFLAIGSVLIFCRILLLLENTYQRPTHFIANAFYIITFIIFSNVIGTTLTGMEHVLALFVTLLITQGLIQHIFTNILPKWFVYAVILAPLVRYELLAISGSAILYCIFLRQWKIAAAAILGVTLLLSSFSYFLISLGLEPLPSSILVKSNTTHDNGFIQVLLENTRDNLSSPQGQILIAISIISISMTIRHANKKIFAFIAASIVGIIAHIIGGKFGWFNRYEMHIWIYAWIMLLVSGYVFYGANTKLKPTIKMGIFIILGLLSIWANKRYINGLTQQVSASKGIYLQQFQMARFLKENNIGNIGANDIGLIAYQNDNYVLDFWGLAYHEAYKQRKQSSSTVSWMAQLATSNDVGMVMIYPKWFNAVPAEWVLLAKLTLHIKPVTVGGVDVSFISTQKNIEHTLSLCDKLALFGETIPPGAKLTLTPVCLNHKK